MDLDPPRHHERRTGIGDLAPIEGNEPHTKSRYSPKQLVDDEVVCAVIFVSCSILKIREKVLTRRHPAHPGKIGQAKEQKAREKRPQKNARRSVQKEPIATQTRVVFFVECIEKRAANEVWRPHHIGWPDQKFAADACEAKAGEGSGQDEKDREPRAKVEAIIQLCDDDSVHRVARGHSGICHHVDQHVLLDVEGARIEGESPTTEN